MEIKTTEIRSVQKVFDETKEQAVECDILLPDYYPEIDKIIGASIFPTEEDVSIGADKISVFSNAEIKVLYSSEENRIVSVNQNTKFTKLIPCIPTLKEDVCCSDQQPISIVCRASGPRKIEIRSTVAVNAKLFRNSEQTVISTIADESTQTLSENRKLLQKDSFCEVPFEMKYSVSLPENRDNYSAVFNENIGIQISEIKSIANKIMIKGTVILGFSAIKNDGDIIRDLHFQFPFSEIKDLPGIKESSQIRYCIAKPVLRLDLRSGDSNSGETDANVKFKCILFAGTYDEHSFVKDAFWMKGESETDTLSVMLPAGMQDFSRETSINGTLEIDLQNNHIAGLSSGRTLCTVTEDKGNVKLCTNSEIIVYYTDKDKKLRCEKTTVVEEVLTDLSYRDTYCFLNAEIREPFIENIGAKKARISGKLSINGFHIDLQPTEFMKEYIQREEKEKSAEKIILYYADAEEKIWNLAKKYKSSVDEIKNINQLNEDILSEQKLLILQSGI